VDDTALPQPHRVPTALASLGQFLTNKTALTRQRDRRNGLDFHRQWQGALCKERGRRRSPRICRLSIETVVLEPSGSDLCGNGGLTNSQSRGRGTGSGEVAPFGCGRAQRKILSCSIGGMCPSLKARAKYALSASHGE
jgi:hypothetical protein